MGCASSKVLVSEIQAEKGQTGFSKSISMATHPQELLDDFHIVALTSSTYGILKVDPPKAPGEDSKDAMGAQSVKEVLNKLDNLESSEEAAPQSWLEVSSMLENLKPDLETPAANTKSGKANSKPQQLDAIDISDIMMDLDEETGLVRPRARKLANLRKTGKSLPIHTLEELDRRVGAKENNAKLGGVLPPAVSIADARASLKPVGAAKHRKSNVDMSVDGSVLHKDKQKTASKATDVYNGTVDKGSGLIDNDDFMVTYKNALSEDDWKVVEALCQDAATDLPLDLEDEKNIIRTHLNTESMEEHATKSSYGTSPVKDDKEQASSLPIQGNPLSSVSSTTDPASSKVAAVTPKRALEVYEELCPPGGKQAVVLYTTSLRGIRKTYEDCIRARDILRSHGVLIDERDVSMHLEYRNELRDLMQRVVTVPRLFIKGRYIGGSEVISKLAEERQLADLLEGSTKAHGGTEGVACEGCAGAKFVPCLECSGSCKILDDRKQAIRCPECNENGLIQCPICS